MYMTRSISVLIIVSVITQTEFEPRQKELTHEKLFSSALLHVFPLIDETAMKDHLKMNS